MGVDKAWSVRQATVADDGRLRRQIAAAERVALRLHTEELVEYLSREPFLLAEEAGELRGFLAFLMIQPPQATLVAAGLADDMDISPWLDRLLPRCVAHLRARGAALLSYIGSADWLIEPLQARGFHLLSHIVAYEKTDEVIPNAGAQTVRVRPVRPADLPALVALDEQVFHPLWRNSAATLNRWRATLPYFAVAVTGDELTGYCYGSVEGTAGHLIRMAVHPAWQGQGIGTRLLAEAMGFFRGAGVRRITLNTQEENDCAQRLYRKFGFRLLGREAVALWRDL